MPVGASVLGNLLISACLIALFTDIAGGLLNASLPFFASARLRNVTQLSSIFSLLMAVA